MDLWKSLIEEGNIWALLIMTVLFVSVAIVQEAHEKGKKWARPVQYGIAAIFISLFIWLVIVTIGN
jgi:hypothetical protein